MENFESNDWSGAGDGLHFKKGDSEVKIVVAEDSASLQIEGPKQSAANYIEIKNENNEILFGISNEGHLIGSHLFEDDPNNLDDSNQHSSFHHGGSIYLGNCRISFLNEEIKFEKIKLPPPGIFSVE